MCFTNVLQWHLQLHRVPQHGSLGLCVVMHFFKPPTYNVQHFHLIDQKLNGDRNAAGKTKRLNIVPRCTCFICFSGTYGSHFWTHLVRNFKVHIYITLIGRDSSQHFMHYATTKGQSHNFVCTKAILIAGTNWWKLWKVHLTQLSGQ
jgi:hypothetical protein